MIKINASMVDRVIAAARASTRGRKNYNLHDNFDARLQRLLNAAEPGTYVRPHKHRDPHKVEVFVILTGKVAVLGFDDKGTVTEVAVLDARRGDFGVEIPPGTWHTFICLETGSVLFEAKPGPYDPAKDKLFPAWAPEEGTAEGSGYVQNLVRNLELI